MKDRDPRKDQFEESLIYIGLFIFAALLVGLIFCLANLFGIIFKLPQ